MKLDLSQIKNIHLGGRGGKEKEISKILSQQLGWERKNRKLYDYCNNTDSSFVETKKQVNQQWFDPTKYFNLTDEEKQIKIMFFIIDKKGYIEQIVSVNTSEFVKTIWTDAELSDSADYHKKYPKNQIKQGIHMRDWIKNNSSICTKIYPVEDSCEGKVFC